MRKTISLILLGLLCSVGSVWADEDPTLTIGGTSQESNTFLKAYATEGITIASDQSFSSGAVQIGTVASAANANYLEVLSSKGAIAKISFKLSGNGSNKSLEPVILGWEGEISNNAQADTYSKPDAQTTTANSYAAAKWFDIDFSSKDLQRVRIYKGTKNISSTDPSYTGSSTALGGTNTIKVWGIKVWLKASKPGTIVFSPDNSTSRAAGTQITLSSEESTSIKWQWGSSTPSADSWSSAQIYAADNKPAVPAVGSTNTTLYVRAYKSESLYRDGSAEYEVTDSRTALTLTFTASETTLEAGGSTQATSLTSDQTYSSAIYSSNDEDVATVSSEGVITPKAAGSATITVRVTPTDLGNYKPTNKTLDITVKEAATKWDFTSVTSSTYDYVNLVADAESASGEGTKWTVSSSQYSNKGEETNVSLVADGKTLTSAKGLLFSFTVADAFRYDVGNNRAWVKGNQTTITIPNLKKGDVVQVVAKASGGTEGERGFTLGNLSDASWTISKNSNTTKSATVSSDGNVTITGNGGCYLYKIEITKCGVTISSAGWATYVNNDYDLDFSGKSIKAYRVDDMSGATLELVELSNVKAGTPVLLEYEGGKTESIPVMTGADDAGDNLLVPGTGASVVSDETYDCYVLANQNNVLGFYKLETGKVVAADKAYLRLNAGIHAPSVIRFVDEENNATDISNVDASEEAVKFIQDGKLFIKKNGVVYDMMGTIVK